MTDFNISLYFSLQYYFLNNTVNGGGIPQWIPFMTHGTVANFWYVVQAGLLQNLLLHTGTFFSSINFVTLFHLGIFVDSLLLIIGVWLLSRRFFGSSYTVFFVTVSASASSIWVTQPWWNFHFYYALPLILHFFHSFLNTGKWRYFFFAGNLLAFQTLGNLPYFIPVISLVVFIYGLSYWLFNYQEVGGKVKNLHLSWESLISFMAVICSFTAVYFILRIGTDQLASYNMGRNPDGTSSLQDFLSYGDNLGLVKWNEFFLGVSPALDYSLYLGFLAIPLLSFAVLRGLQKRTGHFFVLTIIILLFSMGTPLAAFFYYTWPMMKYFRHLALLSPLVKLFLCFLAGIGFEAVFIKGIAARSEKQDRFVSKAGGLFIGLLFVVLSCIFIYMSNNLDASAWFILEWVNQYYLHVQPFDGHFIFARLSRAGFLTLVLAFFFLVLPWVNVKKYRTALIGFVLCFHVVNMYGYKFSEVKLKTMSLDNEQYGITAFQSLPFSKRRDILFWDNNARGKIFFKDTPSIRWGLWKYDPQALIFKQPLYGTSYWTTNAFLFKDQAGSSFRVDSWLLPLDQFLRAYWNQPINDISSQPKGLVAYKGMLFPAKHPGARKIAGISEDKIQFFSKVYPGGSNRNIAEQIAHPGYQGNALLISPSTSTRGLEAWSFEKFNGDTSRMRLPYQVNSFDSNALSVSVDCEDNDSVWMLYSDVWHPFWEVTVNGKKVPLNKANLAYKALPLESGKNDIRFSFGSKWISFLYTLFGINAIFWIGFLMLYCWLLIFGLPGCFCIEKKSTTNRKIIV